MLHIPWMFSSDKRLAEAAAAENLEAIIVEGEAYGQRDH